MKCLQSMVKFVAKRWPCQPQTGTCQTVIQVYAPTSNAKEVEVDWFYEDLQDLLELTPKKRCPFHYRGLECESHKSKDTWSNKQVWPWSTK